MKIADKKLDGVPERIVVLPRDSGDIILKVRCVKDFSAFNEKCPKPKAGEIVKPGGTRFTDVENPEYKKELQEWAEKRSAWILIQSLAATTELVWDTVVFDDPTTWKNSYIELDATGMPPGELDQIMSAVLTVNGFSQQAFDDAKNRFLAGQEAENFIP